MGIKGEEWEKPVLISWCPSFLGFLDVVSTPVMVISITLYNLSAILLT